MLMLNLSQVTHFSSMSALRDMKSLYGCILLNSEVDIEDHNEKS